MSFCAGALSRIAPANRSRVAGEWRRFDRETNATPGDRDGSSPGIGIIPPIPPANPRGAAPRRGVPVERSAPPVGHTHRQRPWFPTSPPRALVLSRSGACRFRIGDPVAPHDAASPASPRPTARVASSAPPAPTSSPYRAAAPSAPPSRCVTRPRNTPVRSRATGSAPAPRSASARGCARGSVLPPAGGSPSPGCTRSSTRALNRFGECTGSLTLAARSPS